MRRAASRALNTSLALPFQDGPRRLGNSVFVDAEWVPYEDQWAYLSSVRRVSYSEVFSLVFAFRPAAERRNCPQEITSSNILFDDLCCDST